MLETQGELLDKVRAVALSASEHEGCLLYDLEFTTGQSGRVLRVFIDREPGPVNLDDCANVSRRLNAFLEENESLIPGGAYELEVSSPGVERRLSQSWHYEKAIGQPVRIKTCEPTRGGLEDVTPQTLLDGLLMNFENEMVTIRKDGRDWSVPLKIIAKAQVRLDIPEPRSKGKKKR